MWDNVVCYNNDGLVCALSFFVYHCHPYVFLISMKSFITCNTKMQFMFIYSTADLKINKQEINKYGKNYYYVLHHNIHNNRNSLH